MKNLFLVVLIWISLSCNHSKRGSGNIVKEARAVTAFTGISVAGAIKADVTIGEKASIIVETDDNIMPYVKTNVSGNILNIDLKNINDLRNSIVYVHIVSPEINDVSASASAEIVSGNLFTTKDKVTIRASSSASIDLNVNAPSINVDASSGAEVNGKGNTREITANSSSGSSINFLELHSETANVTASSGSSISVFASIGINANASSGAKVKYKGGAKTVQKNASSGGTVNME